MKSHKINFDNLPWEEVQPGLRHKTATCGNRRLRLVEYTREMEPHWCEKGHCGCILEGILAVEFAGGKLRFGAGDGICLPAGAAHRHRGRAVTDVVRAFFVEDA